MCGHRRSSDSCEADMAPSEDSGSVAHLHYGAPRYEMLVVIGERPATRQRLVDYRPEYILQPGEVTSHADNRLHDATGHYFHGFHKLGTRGMTRSVMTFSVCTSRLVSKEK